MQERLIESWLDKANERLFQRPFAYILASKGYRVIHIARHSAMEQGKDILAIAPDGVPCAFQLKGAPNGRIGMKQWRDEINKQVFDLVVQSIQHPSIPTTPHHRSFLVTNGSIEEEVAAAIANMNQAWSAQGLSAFKLETIVGGEIAADLKTLGAGFWPEQPADMRSFLELFLDDGHGPLSREKFSHLLESTFEKVFSNAAEALPATVISRSLTGMAILSSLALTRFSECDNFVAELEGWIIYCSYVLAAATRWELKDGDWLSDFEIGFTLAVNALDALVEQLRSREVWVEGSPLSDGIVFNVRVTQALGFICAWALHHRQHSALSTDELHEVRNVAYERWPQVQIWGEGCLPSVLACYWLFRKADATIATESILIRLIELIASSNKHSEARCLPNPYHAVEEVLPVAFGLESEPLNDSFRGRAYYLMPIFQLLVRENRKQACRLLWPDVSRIGAVEFRPSDMWHTFRWRNGKQGKLHVEFPSPRQEWETLKKIAHDSSGSSVPPLLRRFPTFALLFLIAFPHRGTGDFIRWLSANI